MYSSNDNAVHFQFSYTHGHGQWRADNLSLCGDRYSATASDLERGGVSGVPEYIRPCYCAISETFWALTLNGNSQSNTRQIVQSKPHSYYEYRRWMG